MIDLLAISLHVLLAAGALHAPRIAPLPSTAAAAPDSAVVAARRALDRGQPWRASRAIAPALADSARRTPVVVMTAATAASRWGGWAEVDRLLGKAPWLDSLYPAEGRLLLARAALELGRDSVALRHAAVATTAGATEPLELGHALLLLARALDRVEAHDSAAAAYRRAAAFLPAIGDWLRLRAAGVTVDSAARAGLYAGLADTLVRARIPRVEAAVRERTGDRLGAASRYEALGMPVRALRLRLEAVATDAERSAIRRTLMSFIGTRSGSGDAREAIRLLDSAFTTLTPAEELVIARSAAASGVPARAVEGFGRAFAAKLGTTEDRFAYASALFRLGRYDQAAFHFNLVRAPRSLAASAAYQRARALVRDGQLAEGRSALREILRKFPRDTGPASSALFLLGDLATDEQRDAPARDAFRSLAARYPTSRFAASARFRAALIAYVDEAWRQAALELDSLARRYPRSDEAVAATYWSGRAWAATGDTALARRRWEEVVSRHPLSYYAGLAERRLGVVPWTVPAAADSFPSVPAVDSGFARAALLDRIGLDAEARLEYDRLRRDADASTDRLLATAAAFRTAGLASQAIRLGRQALARGVPADARVYRLIYPVVHEEALVAESAEHGLDPSFVAALIRQESLFNPAATSSAGARGLMQVMPDLGRKLAASLGFPVWDPVLLYQPDVSIQMGTYHLAELVERYDRPVHILAAYNAGVSRVTRWVNKKGVSDPEVFAERIPYVETRDYVRIIQRNQDVYRALYAWQAPAASLGSAPAPAGAGGSE